MGSPRYTATLTFSSSALRLLPVKDWLVGHPPDRQVGEENDSQTSITVYDCRYGNIELTRILQEFQVPYDHWHEESEGDTQSWTEYIRYEEDGAPYEATLRESDEAVALFAREVIGHLAGDKPEEGWALLRQAQAKLPVDLDDITFDPDNDHAKKVLSEQYPELLRQVGLKQDPLYDDMYLDSRELELKYGSTHPRFPAGAWRKAVDAGSLAGYWDWVSSQIDTHFEEART